MSVIQEYHNHINAILSEVFDQEATAMEEAAAVLAEANKAGRSIFGFGCNHAGLITLELSPPTMTSEMERIPGYGKIILNNEPCQSGDVLIIHSVSGRNAVTIDMAECARHKGMTVIVVTNMNTASSVTSRHPSGKMLHDFATILIDNHGDLGDATIQLDGFEQKLASTSTVVGAAILNAITARASEILWEEGIKPPVFMSGNIDGGDAYNKAVITEHRDNIFYM